MISLLVLATLSHISLGSLVFPCINSKQNEGLCLNLEECPPLKELFLRGEINPLDVCSLYGGQIMVCCEKSFIKKRPNQKYCDKLKTEPFTQAPGSTIQDDNIFFEIYNGELALNGEFPHMAALVYKNNPNDRRINVRCGGTLISSEYVITAAHCVRNREYGPPIKVILGTNDIRKWKDERKSNVNFMEIEVESVCVHPEYRALYAYNDIALIRLKAPIWKFTSYVRPACLNNEENIPDDETLFILGWGGIDLPGTIQSSFLRWAENKNLNLEICNEIISQDHPRHLPFGVSNSQICTSDSRGIYSSSSCKGDSGGPLQSNLMREKYLVNLVGIISYGMINCGGEYPSVYTRVSYFLDWIEHVVWLNETRTDNLCK